MKWFYVFVVFAGGEPQIDATEFASVAECRAYERGLMAAYRLADRHPALIRPAMFGKCMSESASASGAPGVFVQ